MSVLEGRKEYTQDKQYLGKNACLGKNLQNSIGKHPMHMFQDYTGTTEIYQEPQKRRVYVVAAGSLISSAMLLSLQ